MEAWLNNPQLRESIRQQLDEWASWSRGSINLHQPDHQPFTTPPHRDPPPVIDQDRAARTERVISTWSMASGLGKRLTFVLKLRYVERRAFEDIAVHYNRRHRTRYTAEDVEILCEDAEWFFYLLIK